jgi:RNAse (barnase) inhibitor barstar
MEVYEIDGANFSTIDEFFEEITKVLSLPSWWGRNYDALNDVLGGGFGLPDTFVLRWRQHALSRERLGYTETVRYLESKRDLVVPQNRASFEADLISARNHWGPTVYDTIIEILNHQRGRVQLELA